MSAIRINALSASPDILKTLSEMLRSEALTLEEIFVSTVQASGAAA